MAEYELRPLAMVQDNFFLYKNSFMIFSHFLCWVSLGFVLSDLLLYFLVDSITSNDWNFARYEHSSNPPKPSQSSI